MAEPTGDKVDRDGNIEKGDKVKYYYNFKSIKSITFSVQASLENAKYSVTIARKIGAPVYALPEDISEVSN